MLKKRPAWFAGFCCCLLSFASAQVETGLDRLVAQEFVPLEGKTVAILTHQAAVDGQGRHLLAAVPQERNFRIKALLAPEHGFFGKLDQEGIADSLEPATGLTIFSLYGKTKRPTAAMLAGVDVLVIDLFDIGTRFYTYQTTLLYALEACAEQGVAVMVLDRPNPIGGLRVDGPVLEPSHFSFVGAFAMPVVHGMTLGEMAQMFVGERNLKLELQVMAVRGWQRGQYFPATGLPWINPSPNMRNPTQAVLYPAIGLLEYTNVSVGRGTDAPFERLGAPWIDAVAFARDLNAANLPGLVFTPHVFRPESGPYVGQDCGGVIIGLEDKARYQPFRTSVALVQTLQRRYTQAYQPQKILRLLGHDRIAQAILAGKPWATIEAMVRADYPAFTKMRQQYFLY